MVKKLSDYIFVFEKFQILVQYTLLDPSYILVVESWGDIMTMALKAGSLALCFQLDTIEGLMKI